MVFSLGLIGDFGMAAGSQFKAADIIFQIVTWMRCNCENSSACSYCNHVLISLGHHAVARHCLQTSDFTGNIPVTANGYGERAS